jgi:hypothetical protein
MHDPYEDPVERPEGLPSVMLDGPFINLLKARSPIYVLPIQKDFLPFIGYVALAWGFFEGTIEKFLEALQAANKSTKRWRGLSFNEKRRIFKSEANQYFTMHPLVALYLCDIVDKAVDLQKKRNLLLHGHISLRGYTQWIEGEPTARATIMARIQKKDRLIEEEFSVESVEDLYYSLANLSGRINRFSYPINLEQFPRFSLHDISFLQEFLRLHYHPPSI